MIRRILSQNPVALRDARFAEMKSVTARNKHLAAECSTTLSQIQRIVAGKLGVSIDFLELLANALKVRPQDLCTPYFTVQPDVTTQSTVREPEVQPDGEPFSPKHRSMRS